MRCSVCAERLPADDSGSAISDVLKCTAHAFADAALKHALAAIDAAADTNNVAKRLRESSLSCLLSTLAACSRRLRHRDEATAGVGRHLLSLSHVLRAWHVTAAAPDSGSGSGSLGVVADDADAQQGEGRGVVWLSRCLRVMVVHLRVLPQPSRSSRPL